MDMHPYVKRGIGMVVMNGEMVMKQGAAFLERKHALDDLVGEKHLFQKVYAELCPVRNYALEAMNKRNFEPLDSVMPINALRAFYNAKEFLQYSLETGKLHVEEKQALLAGLDVLEDQYVTGFSGKVKRITDETVQDFGDKSFDLLLQAEGILRAYIEEEQKLRQPYRREKSTLYKEIALSVAGTIGIMFIGRGLGKLGKIITRV
ncbi:MAG: hypothetical protein V1725_05325 [archaeon]